MKHLRLTLLTGLLSLITTAAAATPYSDAVLADNPLSYWRLDETTGTTAADSTGTHSGTYIGGPTLGQAGPPLSGMAGDRSVLFDGVDDYVSLPVASLLDGLSSASVEAWVRPDAGFKALNRAIFYTSNAGASNNFVLQTDVGGGEPRLFIVDTLAQSSTALVAGQWSHVVGTYDGATMKVYIDGVLEASTSKTGALSDAGIPKNIGRYQGTGPQLFLGNIDEVAIYGFALSAKRVAAHHAAATQYSDAVLADNPLSYWRLDETTGTTAADSTGTHSGTYVGGPTLGQAGPPLSGMAGDRSVLFDGVDDSVSLPVASLLHGLGSASVEAWVRPGAGFKATHRAIFYTSNSGASNNFVLQTNIGGGELRFAIVGTVAQSPTALVAEQWSHVVGTYDGATMKVYINGILEVSTPRTGALSDAGIEKNIGRYQGTNTQMFLGNIDEVAIYGFALSAEQVAAHHAAALGAAAFASIPTTSSQGRVLLALLVLAAGSAVLVGLARARA